MENAAPTTESNPLLIRFLRALIVGVLAMLLLYLKVLGAVLKLGMRAIRGIPLGGGKEAFKTGPTA